MNEQFSFLDDSGLLKLDYVCKSDTICALCGAPLPSRKRAKTKYWLAGRPPRRICRQCSNLYVKCFDIRIVKAKRGAR